MPVSRLGSAVLSFAPEYASYDDMLSFFAARERIKMSYNMANAYNEFKKEMDSYREAYKKDGRAKEEYDELYRFCKAQFLRDMAYYRRTQPFDPECGVAGEEGMQKSGLDPADAGMKEPCLCRYEWMDEIDDPVLYGLLNGLLPCELELIDLSVFKKIPKAEIARMKGLDRTTVSRRISRLLSRLGKEMEPHFGQVRLSP